MAMSRSEAQSVTRERLLDAAQEEFSKRPVDEVSIDRIAEIAGYTKGAVYSNFRSKDDLLLAVLERRMRTRGSDYVALLNRSLDEALAGDVGERAAATVQTDLGYFRLVAATWAKAVYDPDLAIRFRAVRQAHRQRLADAIEQRADDAKVTLRSRPEDLAAGLLAMSMATMIEALIDPELDVGAVHSAIADHVLAGAIALSSHD